MLRLGQALLASPDGPRYTLISRPVMQFILDGSEKFTPRLEGRFVSGQRSKDWFPGTDLPESPHITFNVARHTLVLLASALQAD